MIDNYKLIVYILITLHYIDPTQTVTIARQSEQKYLIDKN